jgi:hypothetical protein
LNVILRTIRSYFDKHQPQILLDRAGLSSNENGYRRK